MIADNKIYGDFIPDETTPIEIGEIMLGGVKNDSERNDIVKAAG